MQTGRAKNSARRWCGFTCGLTAPVLSRALGVASIWRFSPNRRFTRVSRGCSTATRDGSKPARLRQGAAEPSARRVFRPTIRPFAHSPIRPFAHSPIRAFQRPPRASKRTVSFDLRLEEGIIGHEWQCRPQCAAENRRGVIGERNDFTGEWSFSLNRFSPVVALNEVKYSAGLCTEGSESPPLFRRVSWLF